jgi:hypothetical protein
MIKTTGPESCKILFIIISVIRKNHHGGGKSHMTHSLHTIIFKQCSVSAHADVPEEEKPVSPGIWHLACRGRFWNGARSEKSA